MNYLALSIAYVVSDQFFWLSMATTTIIGICLGAVLYDGLLTQIKKTILVLIGYVFLVMTTDMARILPLIATGKVVNPAQPLAAVTTMAFVTLFYCAGMLLGVGITNKAHGGKSF